jgi:hypothetical protein
MDGRSSAVPKSLRTGFGLRRDRDFGCVVQECVMFRGLLLRTITALLFASPLLSVSWAQDKAQPPTAPPYLAGAEITSQLNYSCPSETACSFICSGGVGGGAGGGAGADHVTKLTVYLGTMPLGNDQNAPALFYDFSTRERANSSGFSISAGLSAFSCQVNGLKLDYVGRVPHRQPETPARQGPLPATPARPVPSPEVN